MALHLAARRGVLILWASQPFGFVRCPTNALDRQLDHAAEKNPDAAELVRGHSGRIVGALTSLMITMKGLPLAYSKDMQDDKPPVFEAAGLLALSMAAMTGMIARAAFEHRPDARRGRTRLCHRDRSRRLAGARGAAFPFREAHHITGARGEAAEQRGVRLDAAGADGTAGDRRADRRARVCCAVGRRFGREPRSYGGTAPARVRAGDCSCAPGWQWRMMRLRTLVVLGGFCWRACGNRGTAETGRRASPAPRPMARWPRRHRQT
jgi:argininosuccinate lyase